MPKKLTLDQINEKLRVSHPHLRAIKRLPKSRIVFLDENFGEFEGNLTQTLKGLIKHPMRQKSMKNLPLDELNRRLHEQFPFMTILKNQGIQSPDSLICDDEYGEFKGRIEFVIKGLKFHPTRSKFIRADNCKKHYKKRKARLIEKYGVENVSNLDWVVKKREKTFLEKFGGHPMRSGTKSRSNVEAHFLKKFGGKSAFAAEEIREKSSTTIVDRYGVDNPMKSKEIARKSANNRLQKMKKEGKLRLIDGLTIKEFLKKNKKNFKRCWADRLYAKYGPEFVKEYNCKVTYIEKVIKDFLDAMGVTYICRKRLGNYEADFRIENPPVVIECDGLYYHSELIKKDKLYHQRKRNYFRKKGYTYLCFREDEITEKLEIVKGMIKFHLSKSQKVYARKCGIQKISNKEAALFFNNNHLMGNGNGPSYALIHSNQIVSALQMVMKKNTLEVSRFCSKLGVQVVGGLSKLLKHVQKIHHPGTMISFVDGRYGDGHSLEKIGFIEKSNYVSFRWTDMSKTYHRLTFPSNQGYGAKCCKIWDCGQIKFVKEVSCNDSKIQ